MHNFNLNGVTRGTWVRTAALALALLNQGLVIAGVTQKRADPEQITAVVSYVLTAAGAVWSWWKNNSFTAEAQQADEILHTDPDAKG